MIINQNSISNTAILLFSRSYLEESKYKRVGYSSKMNKVFWKQMYCKTIDIVSKTGLTYFLSNESNQSGDTFGLKLCNAIQEIKELGYEKIIVVGNDCPQLSQQLLFESINFLENNDIVIGPDKNGGTYLIGMKVNFFNFQAFKSFRWKTSYLLNDINTFFDANEIITLPELLDINYVSDIRALLNVKKLSYEINTLLHSLLNKLNICFEFLLHISVYACQHYFNKGSPAV